MHLTPIPSNLQSGCLRGNRPPSPHYAQDKVKPNKKTRLCRRVEWQRPIFPQGCPCSIVGAGRLNYRVRDGNGCFPSAIVTTPPARTSE